MLDVAPDRFTLQGMEKKPEESYKEYAMRWKAVASQVQPPLTHREVNSYFVDTLPSPYYDMLVGNAFLEFGDLLYVVGRIEYGIKNGRIANTEAKVPEQRRKVIDKHIRATSVEKKNKRKFKRRRGNRQELFSCITNHVLSTPTISLRKGSRCQIKLLPK